MEYDMYVPNAKMSSQKITLKNVLHNFSFYNSKIYATLATCIVISALDLFEKIQLSEYIF